MAHNDIKQYTVVLHKGHRISATVVEAYSLRDAMTMGFDFLERNSWPTFAIELTVVEIPKAPVPGTTSTLIIPSLPIAVATNR